MNYFSEKDYIFAQQSAIIIPEQLSSQQKQEMLKNYAKDKVKPEVTKHITYMNNNAYQINRQLQNETTENRQSKVLLPCMFLINTKQTSKVSKTLHIWNFS